MHETAVSPDLLDLLRFLAKQPDLAGFSLGGGTNLALRYGHRTSIDLDWFVTDSFDSGLLQENLHSWFQDVLILSRTPGSLCCVVKGVKLDFLLHTYPRLQQDDLRDECRFVSLPDLAAMKINAVTNRGSKKDFSDLLLLHESAGIALSQSLDLFCSKYGKAGRALALRSLIWFEDAEEEPDPLYLNGWTWSHVRQTMENLGQQVCRQSGF